MPRPILITGAAGTGKTTKLLELTAAYGGELLRLPHQRVLAMAYMHGARQRLDASLAGHGECRGLSRVVTTVDSFALSLVNRWRRALGLRLPVTPTTQAVDPPAENLGRLRASFSQVASWAAELLRRPSVAQLTAASYPLVVIDEFQDCVGPRLDIVESLAGVTQLLVAADPFQRLDLGATDCPAVDWTSSLGADGLHAHHCLTEPHRFATKGILAAALALRDNVSAEGDTIPVYFGTDAPTAWKMADHLVLGWYAARWKGSTALICPTGGTIVSSVLAKMNQHLQKQGRQPVAWCIQSTSEDETRRLHAALGVTEADQGDWTEAGGQLDGPLVEEAVGRVRRFARLRGLPSVPKSLVATFASELVQAIRAHAQSSARRLLVTTVHGAKNREFDNVFVLWPYQLKGDAEYIRRLLYNAVTRAKKNCIILDTRKKKVVEADPVMRLLGTPRPVLEKQKKPKSSKAKAT